MTPEFSEVQPAPQTPADFPRRIETGAIAGAAHKYIARDIDGKFLVGDTQEEAYERYVSCCSLVSDLIAYCYRKQKQASWTGDALFEKVERGLKDSPQLELTQAELQWVMHELAIHMRWKSQS